jgi:hypothetical protein
MVMSVAGARAYCTAQVERLDEAIACEERGGSMGVVYVLEGWDRSRAAELVILARQDAAPRPPAADDSTRRGRNSSDCSEREAMKAEAIVRLLTELTRTPLAILPEWLAALSGPCVTSPRRAGGRRASSRCDSRALFA